jgi:hypothetical protein
MRNKFLLAAAACLLATPVLAVAASPSAPREYLFEQPPAGTPNFTGKWKMPKPVRKLLTTDGKAPPLNAAGLKKYAATQAAVKKDPKKDPNAECLPQGVPRLTYSPYPFLIIQTTRAVALVHEANHTFRIAYWNEPLPDDWAANWLGHASARMEGKTLVIDTEGFNAETWLDYSGLPHGEKLKVQERFTLTSPTTIKGEVVITDPDFYTRPWRSAFTLVKQPGMTLPENVCQDTHQM